jgi:hypothetical protein
MPRTRRPPSTGVPLSLGPLGSFADIIAARKVVLNALAAKHIEDRHALTLFAGLTGLRGDMEAMRDAAFEKRISDYEDAMRAAASGQGLERPGDATLQ